MDKLRHRFVSVEGGEGVGKSQFVRRLAARLKARDIPVTLTREPGGTVVADRLRQVFADPPDSEPLLVESELLIVSAARAQHTKYLIQPALRESWVICDRYADSTRVYQGVVGGMDRQFIEKLIDETTFGVEPDITFVLDCDPEIALARISGRTAGKSAGKSAEKPAEKSSADVSSPIANSDVDGAARYDQASLETHVGLRKGFLQIAGDNPQRTVVLDASQSPEKVVDAAMAAVEGRRFV